MGPGESDWLAWIDVQKEVARVGLSDGDSAAAVALLNEFLRNRLERDLQREVLAFSGFLYQESGDLARAEVDFARALELGTEGYVRFELQDTLAEINRRQGNSQESDKWYLAALRTGASDPRVMAGGFLLRLLRFRGDRGLDESERQLAEKLLEQGWRLLEGEGELALDDLERAAQQLVEAQQRRAEFPGRKGS